MIRSFAQRISSNISNLARPSAAKTGVAPTGGSLGSSNTAGLSGMAKSTSQQPMGAPQSRHRAPLKALYAQNTEGLPLNHSTSSLAQHNDARRLDKRTRRENDDFTVGHQQSMASKGLPSFKDMGANLLGALSFSTTQPVVAYRENREDRLTVNLKHRAADDATLGHTQSMPPTSRPSTPQPTTTAATAEKPAPAGRVSGFMADFKAAFKTSRPGGYPDNYHN